MRHMWMCERPPHRVSKSGVCVCPARGHICAYAGMCGHSGGPGIFCVVFVGFILLIVDRAMQWPFDVYVLVMIVYDFFQTGFIGFIDTFKGELLVDGEDIPGWVTLCALLTAAAARGGYPGSMPR